MKIVIKFLLFLLFYAPLIISQNQSFIDVKRSDPVTGSVDFPGCGFQHETYYWGSTMYKGKFYVGSSPNGHIFSFNPLDNGQKDITDHGVVFNTPNSTSVRAMVSDTNYIYGGTSEMPCLFYLQVNGSAQNLISFGYDSLIQNKIKYLFSPKLRDQTNFLEIYFGTICTDSVYRIVRWKVYKNAQGIPTPNTSFNNVSIIVLGYETPPIPSAGIVSLALIKEVVNDLPWLAEQEFVNGAKKTVMRDVIICGSTERRLWRYTCDNGQVEEFMNLPSGITQTQHLVGTPQQNCVWLYDTTYNSAYKFNVSTQTIEISKTVTIERDAYDMWQEYSYYNDYIYFKRSRLPINGGNEELFSNGDANRLRGYKIQFATDISNNHYVFCVHKWPGMEKPAIDIGAISSNPIINNDTNFSAIPQLFNGVSAGKYGGSVIASIAASNGKLYGDVRGLSSEFTCDVSTSSIPFQYNKYYYDTTGAASATVMLPDPENNMMYYALYDKPYFAWKELDDSLFRQNFLNIQNIISDKYQCYIKGLYSFGDYIYMGTAARAQMSGSKARLLRFNKNNQAVELLTTLESSSTITSLVVFEEDSRTYIYGAGGISIFLYILEENDLIEVDSIKAVSLEKINNQLIVFIQSYDCWSIYLRKYNSPPESYNDFIMKNDICLDSLNGSHLAWGGNMIMGNDGYLYLSYKGAFCNGSSMKSFLHKINVSGSTPTLNSTLYAENVLNNEENEIYSISKDWGNSSNRDIYLGFKRGKVQKLIYNNIEEPGPPLDRVIVGNYPNPFNPSTVIKFNLNKPAEVSLKVYDMLGKEVKTLLNKSSLTGGVHEVEFNGSSLSSGVYFYVLKTNNQIITQKIMLLK